MAVSHSNGGHADRYVSIGVLSKQCGLSPQVLRDYERRGLLSSKRSLGRHRRYFLREAMAQVLGLQSEPEGGAASTQPIAYARVSGTGQSKGFNHKTKEGRDGQQSDLSRQAERLKAYSKEHYGLPAFIYSDTGSGLNAERKQFCRMLDNILAGNHAGAVLLITYKERLIRFNYSLVERINGAKSAKNNTKHLTKETIQLAIELHQQGNAWWDIVERIKDAGHRTLNGDVISYYLLKKNVADNIKELAPLVDSDENTNSFSEWVASHIKKKRGSYVRLSSIHSFYADWGKAKNIEPLSKYRCSKVLRKELGMELTSRRSGYTEATGVEVVNE